MESFLSFLGTVLVAIIGLVGIWIQTKHSDAIKSQKELSSKIDKNIQELREETNKNDEKLHDEISKLSSDSKKGDLALKKQLEEKEMNELKRFLVTEMTKIKSGAYTPTDEQKMILKDSKDIYNERGGDSYVDDMYDDLRDKELI
jgi:hypothetical protein